MNVENLKKVFNLNGSVKFKMYGLDYTIETVDDGVEIYMDLYSNKKSKYDNLDILLKNYTIYNETIESNDDRIINIHWLYYKQFTYVFCFFYWKGGIIIKRKCYFFNEGILFEKNNKKELKDCWNYNGNCCKSDLCNGLWCTEYGIEYNKQNIEESVKYSVETGKEGSYGYIKEVEIDLEDDLWKEIDDFLIKSFHIEKEDLKTNGFIPFEFYEIINDYSSYWEQPDISYIKKDGNILKNVLEIKKEKELDPETTTWINEELYGIRKEIKKDELEL